MLTHRENHLNRTAAALAICLIASCQPHAPARAAPPAGGAAAGDRQFAHRAAPAAVPADKPAARPPYAAPLSPPAGGVPLRPPVVAAWTLGGITFEGVAYDSRSHRLIVVDQPDGPGTLHGSAADAATAVGGIAAVNAGFFTADGDPLGLVVASGKPAGNWNTASSLGSGVWHESPSGRPSIARRQALGGPAARRMPQLLQSGPMLVDGGKPVAGLHGGEPRPRTLVAWDGGYRWWIGRTGPCTLAGLAAALTRSSGAADGPGFQVRSALNLDGGRSSELWVDKNVGGGPLTRRPLWNRGVRNHLVLIPKTQ